MIIIKEKKINLNKGFSLIELCIVIAILSILATIFTPVVSSGIDAWIYKIEQDELLSMGRLVMMRLVNELRYECTHQVRMSWGSGLCGTQTYRNESPYFINANGETITFAMNTACQNGSYGYITRTRSSPYQYNVFTPNNYVDLSLNPDPDGDGNPNFFTFFRSDGTMYPGHTNTDSNLSLIQIDIAIRKNAGMANASNKILYLRTSVRPACAGNCN